MVYRRWLAVVFLSGFLPSLVSGQTPGAPQGTDTAVYGVCSCLLPGTYYHSQVLSAPAQSVGAVQLQFRAYLASLKDQSPSGLTGGCSWSATLAEVNNNLKTLEQISTIKSVQFTWNYDPAAAQATQASMASAKKPPTSSTPPSNAMVSAPTANTGAISANAANDMQAVKMQAVSTVNSSVNRATNDAMQSVSNSITNLSDSATNAVNNLFKKKKAAAPAPVAPSVQPPPQAPWSVPPPSASLQSALLNGASPPVAAVRAVAPEAGGVEFLFCHLKAGGGEYYSEVFPATTADVAIAKMAFWREMSHTYKATPIPFSNNVSCDRHPTEEAATKLRKSLIDTAGQRGVATGLAVQTGWMYTGEAK